MVRDQFPVLAWHLVILLGETAEWHYFISAKSGKLIGRYNSVPHAKYRTVYDYDGSESIGFRVLQEGDPTHSDPIVQNVYDHMGTTYDYFKNTFGRDSYDDNGSELRALVHYGVGQNSATWTTSRKLRFGDGDGSQSGPLGNALDVVAHEFAHGVTETTAGLIYTFQSGALNESMSDIFGVMVDRDDWLIGEDTWTPAIPTDALRYIDDPTLGSQPAHMQDFQVHPFSYDNGGVHINSGIPNKVFYLIATYIRNERLYRIENAYGIMGIYNRLFLRTSSSK